MKITYLTRNFPPETAWGADALLYWQLATTLASWGHEIHVICQASGAPHEYLGEDGIVVHRVGKDPRRYSITSRLNYMYHASLCLRRLVTSGSVDVVEAPYWSAEGLIHLNTSKVPLVITDMGFGDDPWKQGAFSMIQKIGMHSLVLAADTALRRSTRIVATTKLNLTAIGERFPSSAQRIDLVYLGVSVKPPRDSPRGEHVRANLNFSPESQLVLYVGTLIPRRGIHVLIEAIPLVCQSSPRAAFVLAGIDTNTAPGGRSWSQHISASLREYQSRIRYLGPVDAEELELLYAQSDLVVYPALRQSFGLPVLEALAAGKPVVATYTGVVPELGLEPPFGATIASDNPRALQIAVTRLLEETTDNRDIVALRNRKLVETRFTLENWAKGMLKVYTTALRDSNHSTQNV
jgi:glycosyltransferase involved in cell wall biosynthesis